MDLDLDLRALRIFIKVIDLNSFSAAARALLLTQPTVSQQIARLESELGGRLFERVGHEIHATELGQRLKNYALEVIERTERLTEELRHDRTEHAGIVRYAMPESCQWTPHFRNLMAKIKELPKVDFEIDILPSDVVLQSVMEGRADFGFAVGERLHPELRFEHFADEEYLAVASQEKIFKALKENKFSEVRWIAFPGWELFFNCWAKTHGLSKPLKLVQPKLTIGTLAGAIHAVHEGAGIAVLPGQCIRQEIKSGRLKEISPASKVAKYPIHIVRRQGSRLPARSEVVLSMLRESKKTLG